MTASSGSTPKPTPRHSAEGSSASANDKLPPLTKPLTAADPATAKAPAAGQEPIAGRTPAATSADSEPSIGALVSSATEAMSTLVRSEIELAKLELKSTVKNAGTGAGMFIGALVVLIFSLTFGFIALAEGIIALGLHRWLGYLIVFGFMILIVATLAFLGYKKVKAVRAPERTIKTTKETVDFLKSNRG